VKITAIETYIAGNPWKNWLFAKVKTDEGTYGIGEGTLNYFGKTVEAAIHEWIPSKWK
jgi:galactonate dehydratase